MTTNPNTLISLPDNALDYLFSAIEYLEQRTERSLKYAVLHLFAGIELFLKERLSREHWSLIFQDTSQAKPSNLASGDFKSVDFHTCVARLNDIAEVELSKSQIKDLDSLRQLRNRIQHFHTSINQSEATSRLAQGTSFVVQFINSEMSDLNDSRKPEMDRIHEALAGFSEYVSCRMNEIKEGLKSFVDIVWCPRCDQESLGLGRGDPRCLFCGYSDEPFDALCAAARDGVIGHCPDCGGPMGEYGDLFICFSCGKSARS